MFSHSMETDCVLAEIIHILNFPSYQTSENPTFKLHTFQPYKKKFSFWNPLHLRFSNNLPGGG